MLTERRRRILQAVVDRYVSTAAPVGSKVLVEHYGFGVSPATVRSELSALELARLLWQPHTSAGRLPTDSGYRSVVDEYLAHPDLLGAGPLYPEPDLRARLTLDATNVDELVHRVCGALATYTDALAISTIPSTRTGGMVRVCYKGLAGLLAQPEFAAAERAVSLIRLLDDEARVATLLSERYVGGEVTVHIGGENHYAGFDDMSVVVSPWRNAADGGRSGVIAVVGPTRMQYRRAIPAVATAAWTLTDALRN
ncbi:MAG: hypothetical protein LBS17_03990 [Actinomycetes bacterium]|jgi:transcriptional regulator of heat shock response|nr:hypothetical protein [Actinomycetes bacterium]